MSPTLCAIVEDVIVYHGKDRARVAEWIPLKGDRAGLQLYLMIDDGLDISVGSQCYDLRKFMQARPASTAIGLAYMRNGAVELTQNLTTDHAAASKSLGLPLRSYGMSVSPNMSLVDLIHKWSATPLLREVFIITSGLDLHYGVGPDDPYLDRASKMAARRGYRSFNLFRSGWPLRTWLLADRLGIELSLPAWGGDRRRAHWQGLSNPVSFAPFPDDF